MKQLFTALFVMVTALSFGQKESYLINMEITKLVYKGDSIVFDQPHLVEIHLSKTSDIIEIGRINDTYFGVKFEILKSNLEEKESYIAGKVYYVKTKTSGWEEIHQFGHNNITMDKISKKKNKDKEHVSGDKNMTYMLKTNTNSETIGSDPVIFSISYNIYFYMK